MVSNEKNCSGLQWYAVQTKPREEERADSNLRAWGVETCAPKVKESRINQFTNRPSFVSKSLFPGYIFARFDIDAALHQINYTRGVHKVVGFGGVPSPLDDQIINLIAARIGPKGFVLIGEDLVPGNVVTIKDGPLKGLMGVFEREMKDAERVMLLLTCVNYQGRFVVERERLQKAS